MDSLIQGASANDRAQCYLAAHNGARNFTDMFCEGAMREPTHHRAICELAREWGALSYGTAINDNVPDIA
jgi:hypothetical protein